MRNKSWLDYDYEGLDMKNIIAVIMVFSVLFWISNINAGKVYIWTDENGVEHISDKPPPINFKPKEIKNLKQKGNFDTFNPSNDSSNVPSKHKNILENELNEKKTCLQLLAESKILLEESLSLLDEEYLNDMKIMTEKGQKKSPSTYLLRKEESLKKRRKDNSLKLKIIEQKINELRCVER